MKEQEVERVVGEHVGLFTTPPAKVPSVRSVDGPLLGNGDLGVVLSGPPQEQVFWIGKNDFWSRTLYHPLSVGGIALRLPTLAGAGYRQEQDLLRAEVRGAFEGEGASVRTRAWVAAEANLLVIEVENLAEVACPLEAETWTVAASHKDYPLHFFPDERKRLLRDRPPRRYPSAAGVDGGVAWVTRHAEPEGVAGLDVALATRTIGARSRLSSDGVARTSAACTIPPGGRVTLVSAVVTTRDAPGADPLDEALSLAWERDRPRLSELEAAHRAWWRRFWSASFVELDDKRVEGYWYGALYMLGCCARAGKVAPGLWGPWITTDRARWNGDYTLNYNFQSPFWGVFSSNHAELAAPFFQAISDFVPTAREMAREFCCRGVHYPTHLGPYGWYDKRHWGQRTNAAHCALPFIDGYDHTRDAVFLREQAYPYWLAVADFWEDYLERDGKGRYVVRRSNAHEERNWGRNTNPLTDLAFLRRLFDALLRASEELGLDADRRAAWQEILDHLSGFTLMERNGKTIFSLSEDEPWFTPHSPVGIWGVYPGGQVDAESEPGLVEIARNTLAEADAWHSYNGFPSVYTAAVRVGYPGALALLSETLARDMSPNFYVHQGGGGIEVCGAIEAVNEMLLQSHRGYLHLFPAWPADRPARFGRLRARGAFLVSAALREGAVGEVAIESERGGACALRNPWPGAAVRVIDGQGASVPAVVSEERIVFATEPGGRYRLSGA